MADNTSALKALIKGALEAIAEEKGVSASFDEIHLERPKQEDHGDWATNAAMKNCKVLGLGTGWIFFIAPAKSLMQLLAIRDLPLHEMTETELCNLLREKRG